MWVYQSFEPGLFTVGFYTPDGEWVSESDHSEVGSGFIHVNFTPAADKATPSLFGDAVRGVFLRQRPVFLGGHSGVVGPARVGFGTVLAAGSVFRRDAGDGVLVTGEAPRTGVRPYDAAIVRGAQIKARKNFEFLAELAALLAFHRSVRTRLAGEDGHRRGLCDAAAASIDGSMAERVRQLAKFGAVLARSAERLPAGLAAFTLVWTGEAVYDLYELLHLAART